MVNNLEELGELLQQNDLTITDLTFIVNFMQQENMSPQLAMRRIKAFESIKEKLDDNTDKIRLTELEEELAVVKNQLLAKSQEIDQLQNQKTGLESQKMELESKSDLLDSEREELQRQLELLKDVTFDDEEFDDDSTDTKITTLRDHLLDIQTKMPDLDSVFKPLIDQIDSILDKRDLNFNVDQYLNGLERQLKALKPSDSSIRSSSDQVNQSKNLSPTPVKKTNDESDKKIPKKNDEKKAEKKVSAKEEQVLNLFIEFVQEAVDDTSFKDRVSTVCDMDEAYQYLGSIGLSQVYSFGSRGIEKKDELLELLSSWKKEGVPR